MSAEFLKSCKNFRFLQNLSSTVTLCAALKTESLFSLVWTWRTSLTRVYSKTYYGSFISKWCHLKFSFFPPCPYNYICTLKPPKTTIYVTSFLLDWCYLWMTYEYVTLFLIMSCSIDKWAFKVHFIKEGLQLQQG